MAAAPKTAAPRGADDVRPPPVRVASGGGLATRYRSLFVVGKGGMGSVEVALERVPHRVDGAGFERIVALKRLLPEGAKDPRHKEMFLREARLAALLAHPNVVHAFAFGELEGELFLAMEYVPGAPLSRVLHVAREADGALAPELVARILADVCEGLHAAHELRDVNGRLLNVVHRDLSPQNVMVAYEGHVKLLDFGVAKIDAGQSNTKTGEVKGKMAYMSPEQALGDPLDRRSDLFSLGAVLFECLSGRRMWGPGTDLELMRKLALEEPPRLDTVMRGAPPPLVELQARLVARDREARPATALAVADELRAFLASDAPVDPRAVRKLMDRLFPDEAQRQRDALTRALEEAAPAHVEVLRKSLEPSHARVTLPEPVLVARAPRRTALWAALGAIALAAAGVTVYALRRGDVPTATVTPSAATTTVDPIVPAVTVTPSAAMAAVNPAESTSMLSSPSPSPSPSPGFGALPLPAASAVASTHAAATTTPSAPVAPGASVGAPVRPPPSPSVRSSSSPASVGAASAAAAKKPPDVDTKPF